MPPKKSRVTKQSNSKGKQIALAHLEKGSHDATKQPKNKEKKGDVGRALTPPLEQQAAEDDLQADVHDLVKQLKEAHSREEQVGLFGSFDIQTVLQMREAGGNICHYINDLQSDMAVVARSKAAATLREQIKSFDYRGVRFMDALKHWTHVKGVWLSRPIQKDHMLTFARWYVHCNDVTDELEMNRDVAFLTEYAHDLVELHMTHHRPFENWLGAEIAPRRTHLGSFHGLSAPSWRCAQIKHRYKTWEMISPDDTDYDDSQLVEGSHERGLGPFFDIRTYYADHFYVQILPTGVPIRVAEGEGSKRINHLTSLYRNGIVRGCLVDYRKDIANGKVGDNLPPVLHLSFLPKLPNFSWSNQHLPHQSQSNTLYEWLPIFAYCAQESITPWAKLAAAARDLEVLRVAWVVENLWVW